MNKTFDLSSAFFSVFLIIALFGFQITISAAVHIFPTPEGMPQNQDFEVFVSNDHTPEQKLFSYEVEVDAHQVRKSSMVYFDFDEPVYLKVVSKKASIQSVRIRPLSYKIAFTTSGDTVSFRLDKPVNISVELNDDIFNNLQIFTNHPEKNKPNPDDPNLIYLGKGIHEIKELRLKSNQNLYLEGGAVLKGKVVCDKVQDVKIFGRGILYRGERGIEITHSEHVSVEDLIFINPTHYTIYGGQSKNLKISGIRSFSARGWSDGIDLMSCSDVQIDRVFMRNSDDCIALYGHRWNFYGNSKNIQVKNSTLWADVAHPIMIGTHGNFRWRKGEILENYEFKNIDILNHDEMQVDYQGCIAINVSDQNLARNMRFEDIRIENFEQGQLFNIRVAYNKKYAKKPGRGIENIIFRNIEYNGDNAETSIIEGYDAKRMVKNIRFEGLKINGTEISIKDIDPKYMKLSDFAKIYQGVHAENISFTTLEEK